MAEISVFDLKGNSALYEVLGVPRTATQREIRQAYYRLAVVYHPDKNAEGGDVFKEVSFAHGILSDPEQRALYDSGTLRSDIEGKARAYDPSMDPDVELSPETLRAFVDSIRQAQNSTQQEQSAFERRREEEMRRRAEYDARNPAFRAEYERTRRLRQRGLSGGSSAVSPAEAAPAKPRTSAEVLAELQRQEEERLLGISCASPTTPSVPSNGSGLSYKMQLMARFRATHEDEYCRKGSSSACGPSGTSSGAAGRSSTLSFVREQKKVPLYSESVDEKIQTYSNFDYRAFVEEGKADRVDVEEAIMADALNQYDRNN